MTIEIGHADRVFSLQEAREQFGLVQKITQKHKAELAPLQLRLKKMLSNDPRRSALESHYEAVVQRWRTKIEQLGANVSDLWVVEFNLNDGCLCWREPELGLNYFRPAGRSFAQRVKLQDYIDEHDPDWAR